MVTAGTFHRQHLFAGEERLQLLQESLFEIMGAYGWELQAWALFPNHYHFIARACDGDRSLKSLMQRLHSQTSRMLNQLDGVPGRKVWFQYWDTCLTFENSYYPRLNYVHHNPVRHGFVTLAESYPFCSAGWFEVHADPAFRRKVESYRFDRIEVVDDF